MLGDKDIKNDSSLKGSSSGIKNLELHQNSSRIHSLVKG